MRTNDRTALAELRNELERVLRSKDHAVLAAVGRVCERIAEQGTTIAVMDATRIAIENANDATLAGAATILAAAKIDKEQLWAHLDERQATSKQRQAIESITGMEPGPLTYSEAAELIRSFNSLRRSSRKAKRTSESTGDRKPSEHKRNGRLPHTTAESTSSPSIGSDLVSGW